MTNEVNYDYAQAIANARIAELVLAKNPFTITLPDVDSVLLFNATIPARGVVEGDAILVSIGSFAITDVNAADLIEINSITAIAGLNEFYLTINFQNAHSGLINLNWRKN